MGGAGEYAAIIRRVIEHYAQFKPAYGQIEIETVFDEARGHYELMYVGWNRKDRVHGAIIHVDLRGDKVWIQHDGTEGGIAEDLVEAGIPREHIVLAFHDPAVRQHTGFAVT
jgi:XisI protein